MNTEKETMICLVSNQAGIYAANNLIHNFYENLYLGAIENKTPFNIAICNNVSFESETKETIFNPDNQYCDDNIEYCFYNIGLLILNNDDNLYYRIEFIEGDIFAIHPNAIWCEETENYIFDDKSE